MSNSDATSALRTLSSLNGASSRSKSAAFLRITQRIFIRTGMWRAIGMIGVSSLWTIGFSPLTLLFLLVPPADIKFYRSPFLRDFWHLNVAMMTSNNALVPDPDKQDILASKPFDWPFLHLGLRMCGWADSQTKYYLLGTPFIYWGGATSLIVGILTFGIYLMRRQRKYVDMEPSESRLWF